MRRAATVTGNQMMERSFGPRPLDLLPDRRYLNRQTGAIVLASLLVIAGGYGAVKHFGLVSGDVISGNSVPPQGKALDGTVVVSSGANVRFDTDLGGAVAPDINSATDTGGFKLETGQSFVMQNPLEYSTSTGDEWLVGKFSYRGKDRYGFVDETQLKLSGSEYISESGSLGDLAYTSHDGKYFAGGDMTVGTADIVIPKQ